MELVLSFETIIVTLLIVAIYYKHIISEGVSILADYINNKTSFYLTLNLLAIGLLFNAVLFILVS